MQIRPMLGAGAEILNVDLRSIDDAQFVAVRKAFAEHGVVFFREQDIDEAQHIALARRFGDINVNRFFRAHPERPEIALVVKEPAQEMNIGSEWHSDHSYDKEPALGSILVAREVPANGGDTLFASLTSAFTALDDSTKTTLLSLRAIHSAHHVFGEAGYSAPEVAADNGNRIGNSSTADAMIDVVHPIVIRHPLSGRPTLYINPTFTIGIEGMEHGPAFELLHKLYDHVKQEQFVHRFQWDPGSVAIWDNRAVWHKAVNDYHGQRREMHRITIDGCSIDAAA